MRRMLSKKNYAENDNEDINEGFIIYVVNGKLYSNMSDRIK